MPIDRPLSTLPSPARPRPRVRVALAATLWCAASAVAAQGVVTLYGGVRGGGEFIDQNNHDSVVRLDSGATGSASFDWMLSDGRQAQLFYSFQRSALPGSSFQRTSDVPINISYLHLGGRVFFDAPVATAGGYLVGGLGITHFSPGLDGLSAEVRPSANLGIGYEWTLAKQVALRGELRGYLTAINSNGAFFCSGGCVVAIRADTITQFEAMLGLSIGF